MFAMFGVVLFAGNSASTRKAERIRATRKRATSKKKKTARRRTDRTARKQPSVVFGESKSVDWKAAQSPLSLFQKNLLDKYRIGRDYPNAGNKGQWSVPD
jgi:hypothetical protein